MESQCHHFRRAAILTQLVVLTRRTHGGARIVGLEERDAGTQRPHAPLHQPRQCRQHAAAAKRRGGRQQLSSLLLERAPRGRVQVACQHSGIRRGARHDRRFRWRGPETQHRHLRQEHDRGDQQARLSIPCSGYECRPLDRDGASLERSALACPRASRPGARHRRRPARRRRRRPPARRVRPTGSAADSIAEHRMSPVSSSQFIAWPGRRTRSAPRSWSMPRSWRRTGGSTSSRTTIPSTWTTWRCQPTRCTHRSAPAR